MSVLCLYLCVCMSVANKKHPPHFNANKCPQYWWGEAASPCESPSIPTDGHAWSRICVSTQDQKCSIPLGKIRTLSVVPWTPQVLMLNEISISSAVFVWLTVVVNKESDKQTDVPITLPLLWLCVRRGRKTLSYCTTTFCHGASSKSKLLVYCRYLSGRLWWGDVFRLESSSLRPRCSYIQTGIGSPAWCRVWCVIWHTETSLAKSHSSLSQKVTAVINKRQTLTR